MADNEGRGWVRIFDEAEVMFEAILRSASPLATWAPPTDLFITEEFLYVVFEIPGVDKQDLSVAVAPTTVQIRGLRRAPPEFKQGTNFYNLEISYGAFERRVYLPCPVYPEEVTSSFDNGILTLRFPKQKKRVKIIKVE